MSDLINRQAAIEALYSVLFDDDLKPTMVTAKQADTIMDSIRLLPSAWIPCSKRPPEKSGRYYVSGGNKVWICEFLIIPNATGGWCNDASNPVVQAWMELPEPYLEEGERK